MEKLAMAGRMIDLGHCIPLNNTSILAKKSRSRDWEVVEIEFHPNNMNMEDGLSPIP
jgi:hypothetical protein